MARPRKPTPADLEAEADAPPPAAPGDRDADDLMRLLLWGRAKGFRLGPVVRVGNVTVLVGDIRQGKAEGAGMPEIEPDRGIDHEYGLTMTDEPVEGTAG